MRDTRREGAVGRNIGSAAFVSRHVRWVRAVRRGVFGGSASEAFSQSDMSGHRQVEQSRTGQEPRSHHERDFLFKGSERLRIVPSVARSARPRAQTT